MADVQAMNRFVIHAGMPKTGSSSIQATFFGFQTERVSYCPFEIPNLGQLFELLTSETPESVRAFRKRGVSSARVAQDARDAARAFRDFLSGRSGTVLFSAERIGNLSSVSRLHRAQIAKFRDMVRSCGFEPEVVIYIRAPHSFLESSFQQRVKSVGHADFDLAALWPGYRTRIEILDDCFGRSAVHVVPFAPWNFPGNDIVNDFVARVGIDLEGHSIARRNESLSAEAVALIYLQNCFGNSFLAPSEATPQKNIRWIRMLDTLQGSKLRFSDALLAPVIAANHADLEWIEQRMGCRLEDRRSSSGLEISSERELIRLGLAQLDKVELLLRQTIDRLETPPRKKMIQMLEALRALA